MTIRRNGLIQDQKLNRLHPSMLSDTAFCTGAVMTCGSAYESPSTVDCNGPARQDVGSVNNGRGWFSSNGTHGSWYIWG